jgi:phage-related protein
LPARTDFDTLPSVKGHAPLVKLSVRFYATASGAEPVREWLRSLPAAERKIIGEDIKTVQFGWPLGMPLVRKVALKLWEVRSRLTNRIARVLFTVKDGKMVLLHGFIKKTRRTPVEDIRLAQSRIDF